MSLGQRRVCVPIVSGWSCVSREIYKGEQRKIPRYSRMLYHQKGTRTMKVATDSTPNFRAEYATATENATGMVLDHANRNDFTDTLVMNNTGDGIQAFSSNHNMMTASVGN